MKRLTLTLLILLQCLCFCFNRASCKDDELLLTPLSFGGLLKENASDFANNLSSIDNNSSSTSEKK